jgi:hypothetical protein
MGVAFISISFGFVGWDPVVVFSLDNPHQADLMPDQGWHTLRLVDLDKRIVFIQSAARPVMHVPPPSGCVPGGAAGEVPRTCEEFGHSKRAIPADLVYLVEKQELSIRK